MKQRSFWDYPQKQSWEKWQGEICLPDISPCHVGPIEVTKNFFCGGESEMIKMVMSPITVDTLIPLNDLSPNVWQTGFRGEVLYYPIQDYGVLPTDVLETLVSRILHRLQRGKKVGVFCMGGHGRTGYVASVVLGQLGHEDPIGYLRESYCKYAVESIEQVQHIAEVLNRPELASKYMKPQRYVRTVGNDPWGDDPLDID